jgi:hypothetical protein
VQTAILKNIFYSVGQGALHMGLWNQGGGGPEGLGTTVVNRDVTIRDKDARRKSKRD